MCLPFALLDSIVVISMVERREAMFMQMALQKVGVDLCKKLLDCYVTVIMRHHYILE